MSLLYTCCSFLKRLQIRSFNAAKQHKSQEMPGLSVYEKTTTQNCNGKSQASLLYDLLVSTEAFESRLSAWRDDLWVENTIDEM